MQDQTNGMIGVEEKAETLREARARGVIGVPAAVVSMIKAGDIEKGDVLEQSRIAGIIAAKKTSEILPLCHPLRITNIKPRETE